MPCRWRSETKSGSERLGWGKAGAGRTHTHPLSPQKKKPLSPGPPSSPVHSLPGAGRGVYPPVIPYPPPPADASDGAYPITALVHGSPAALGAALVAEVRAAAAAAIKARGAFALAISGGSVHSLLAPLAREAGPDAAKWTVVLADERAVPAASPHCNVAAAAGGWAGKAGVAALLPTPPADAALASDAARAAQAAAGALLAAPRSALPLAPHVGEGGGSASAAAALLPRFDLVLLGIGDDGHVAGLFPNRPELTSPPSGPWVLPVPVPSPTAPHLPRWSLSLPVLNAAGRAIVVAAGGHKATAVARSLETQALPGAAPAQLLRPAGGVTWMLDVDAAAQLHEGKWADPKAWQRNAVGGSKE